jgi:hypothetical protein
MPTEEVVKPELTEEQKRTNKSRTVLKWVVVAIAASCVALFVAIIYQLYQLYM